MTKAVFAGTFDPPTLGHIEIITRAAALFDELIIGVGENLAKSASLLTVKERISLLRGEVEGNVTVTSFTGLVTAFAKEEGASVLVRGLRTTQDLEREAQMAYANKELGGIDTLFLTASGEPFISSTLIRELVKYKSPLEQFVPKAVASLLYR